MEVKMGKLRIVDVLVSLVFASLLMTPVYADIGDPITPEDKETFDQKIFAEFLDDGRIYSVVIGLAKREA